jgi:hypothetical protein
MGHNLIIATGLLAFGKPMARGNDKAMKKSNSDAKD